MARRSARSRHPAPRMRLKRDIVIPAGTILDAAPRRVEYSADHYDYLIGLTNDTAGVFRYCIDFHDDPSLADWFETVEDA